MMNFSLNSEYHSLKRVLLHFPTPEIENVKSPEEVQYKNLINYNLMKAEFEVLVAFYRRMGTKVNFVSENAPITDRSVLYNLMYCRDIFLMTPFGVIISNMAKKIRKGEALIAENFFKKSGINILLKLEGNATFEGADALWLDEKTLIIGVGNRTNSEAFCHISEKLVPFGIACEMLPSYQTSTQHLLGSLQIVNDKVAVARKSLLDPEIVVFLKKKGYTLIELEESDEIKNLQAMNFVTLGPGKIIMSSNCPQTKALYVKEGLEVVAELEIGQLINGGGGLACTTGILERRRT